MQKLKPCCKKFQTSRNSQLSKVGKAHKKLFPFDYPRRRHKRTETPPFRFNYRDYKPYLKREFGGNASIAGSPTMIRTSAHSMSTTTGPRAFFPNCRANIKICFTHVRHATDANLVTGAKSKKKEFLTRATTPCRTTLPSQTRAW